ncbi:MAG: agmatinase, partial [Flavobacteriaceae bacterium]
LRKVFASKNVVGFDIVELAPIEGLTAPQFLVAKLYYKMLSYKFQEEAHTYPHEDKDFLAPSSKKPQKFSDDDE